MTIEAIGLEKHFPIRSRILRRTIGRVRAVDGVDLTVSPGDAVGIVGESGCGKSTLGRLLVRLIEPTGGKLRFDGEETRRLSAAGARAFRQKVQIVFQNPFASLDSRLNIGETLRQPLSVHRRPGDHRAMAAQALERVGLSAGDLGRYPHAFSGGQRQRIAIARALMLEPDVIVCDEVTSALDVSVQAQIIDLLDTLRRDSGVALVFISHDLSVVERLCDRIIVMYLGRVMEAAKTPALFDAPAHPYTQALLGAVPVPDPVVQRARKPVRLQGAVPSPTDPPPGCPFHTRCPQVFDRCRAERPSMTRVAPDSQAACFLHQD